jgi:cell division septation protein DedD
MARSNSPIIQITRKGLFIWIGLIVFIAVWMFVLGVMVGRGMAPVNLESGKLEQELAEEKARMLEEKQEAAVSAAAGQTDEKPQLGFYEALKNPGKEADFKPAKPARPVRRKKAASPRPVAKAAPKPVSRPKIEPPAAPKTDSGPKPAPASVSGHFTIQVASVQDIKGAEKLVAGLRAKGYQAYQIRSDLDGKGVWYRIRVGGFNDRGDAEKMQKKLKNDKYDGIVVSTK